MTATKVVIDFTHTSDATFRVWGAAFSAVLVGIGLVKTADTGQINWATATKPGSSTAAGYEMFKLPDALQATKPIFIKVEYGTNGSAANPCLWFSTGTGTNGAGTLTGATSPRWQVWNSVPVQNAGGHPCYFSGDGSSLTIFCPTNYPTAAGAVSPWIWLDIERTRNADGTPNGDGMIKSYYGLDDEGFGTAEFVTPSYSQATSVALGNTAKTTNMPNPPYGTGVYGLDNYFYPVCVSLPKPEAPAKGMLGFTTGTIPFGEVMQITHLGAVHTYLALGGFTLTYPIGRNVAMIWE